LATFAETFATFAVKALAVKALYRKVLKGRKEVPVTNRSDEPR
jgi:hypothetical protein